MKNKKTYYLLVLDRSGSMNDCATETISGFNEQVQMIRDLQGRYPEQEFFVSLTTFNHVLEHPFMECNANGIKELTRNSYVPSGRTALLDAIGESVLNLKAKINMEIENDEATAVVVILTDGFENASRLFRFEGIRNLIRELESGSKWTFSFLGTTAEAVESALKMNINRRNTAVYEKRNLKQVMTNLGDSLFDYAKIKEEGKKPKDFLKK